MTIWDHITPANAAGYLEGGLTSSSSDLSVSAASSTSFTYTNNTTAVAWLLTASAVPGSEASFGAPVTVNFYVRDPDAYVVARSYGDLSGGSAAHPDYCPLPLEPGGKLTVQVENWDSANSITAQVGWTIVETTDEP